MFDMVLDTFPNHTVVASNIQALCLFLLQGIGSVRASPRKDKLTQTFFFPCFVKSFAP